MKTIMEEVNENVTEITKQFNDWADTEVQIHLGTHMLITNNGTIFNIVRGIILISLAVMIIKLVVS